MIASSPSFAAPLPLGVYTFGAIEEEAVREWQWLFKLPPISIVDSSFAEYDSVSTGKVYALLCIAKRMSNMHIHQAILMRERKREQDGERSSDNAKIPLSNAKEMRIRASQVEF